MSRLVFAFSAASIFLLAQGGSAPRADETRIGTVDTNFRWLGPDDKIVVERYDDPRVNVSCYVSRAATGGFKGAVGLAEDPSRFSVACRATGPVSLPRELPEKEEVFRASASVLFKAIKIYRMLDPDKRMLVYVAISTKLISGSPYNSVTAVPVDAPTP